MARAARLRGTALLIATLVGSSAFAAFPARADHDDVEDPALYVDPHAGYTAPSRAPGRLAPATGALFGTHSDDSHTGVIPDDQKIVETEAAMGRRLDINNSYYGDFEGIADDWEPGNPNKRGLSKLAFWDIEQGRIPLVGWGCGKSSDVAAGRKDDVIRKTAEAMKAFGHEFFMRYCWEMDGNKRASEVGSPETFIAAWKRIYGIFKEVGASNVVWVWCGNAAHFKRQNDGGHWAFDYYPGDEYVDWISSDGYNWGVSDRNSGGDRWRGFVEIFDEFMVWARSTGPKPAGAPTDYPEVFPNKTQVKPIMIGEYGVQEQSSDHMAKAGWLANAHDVVNGDAIGQCKECGMYSDIAAMVYFDVEAANGDWRINSSPESITATREHAGQQPWFNQMNTIGWAPATNRPDYQPPAPPPAGPPPAGQPPAEQPPGRSEGGVVTPGSGYWMLGADAKVFAFGDAQVHGTSPALPSGVEAADIEPTPAGAGYWMVDDSGRVSARGDAAHYGDADRSVLAAGEKVTSLSATPSGQGYWMFTTRGRAMAFGDATHFGDMSAVKLNGPVLDSVPTPSGRGYYMVADDGGIFAFGDAAFHGSMGGKALNAPVQSLVPDGDGHGYWLVASDGGIFAF
ncbi:MAG TPA: glycosyl hydrolase, partial [Acidimicrobiia bacterium]|nr:glycosyl hydrolase [Acidimicrobiia bacterium]